MVGTGYVGLVHAAVCSEYGHEVHAHDIDLEKIAANYERIASQVYPCDIIAVLKANAYGLGAEPIALDGGDVEIVDIKDTVVYCRFAGACASCAGANIRNEESFGSCATQTRWRNNGN